jgi:multidrug efflux pump subunit AcrB
VDLSLAFDFTANLHQKKGPDTFLGKAGPEYLLVDVTLPAAASRERIMEALRRAGTMLQRTTGVTRVLALSDNPFDFFSSGPCLLVRFDPAQKTHSGREQLQKSIRLELDKMPDMITRLRAPVWTRRFDPWAYPIELAVHGPEGSTVRDFAHKLEEKLSRSNKLADVALDAAARPQPRLQFDIDRTRAKSMGLSVDDVSKTLQSAFGPAWIGEFQLFGQTTQSTVRDDARIRPEDVKQLKVRNSQGQMVPVGSFVSVRAIDGPTALDRLNNQPMSAITANPAPGATIEEALRVCERQAEELRKALHLSSDCRLTQLRE